MSSYEIETGTVVRVVSVRGFYFIQSDSGGPDAFLHISALQKANLGEPTVGDRLKFCRVESNGRVQAKPIEYIK
jgi:CspA family cold shock protein